MQKTLRQKENSINRKYKRKGNNDSHSNLKPKRKKERNMKIVRKLIHRQKKKRSFI